MAAPLCLRSASATERIGDGVSFGIGWFETLPLQFWGGLTLEEALAAEEAILSHIEVLLMDGESVPTQRPLEEHQANADYAGDVWALVDADVSKLCELG